MGWEGVFSGYSRQYNTKRQKGSRQASLSWVKHRSQYWRHASRQNSSNPRNRGWEGGGGGGGAEVYILTSCRHKAEDISPSIAWRKESRRKRKRLTILL